MARAAQPRVNQCVPRQMAEPQVSAHHQRRTSADAVRIHLPRDVRGGIGLPYPLPIIPYPLSINHYTLSICARYRPTKQSYPPSFL